MANDELTSVEQIVLTGATGFIGSEVFCRLAKRFPIEKIFVLVRAKPDPRASLFAQRLAEHAMGERYNEIKFFECDFQDETKFRSALKVLPVTPGAWALVHMAAVIHPLPGEEKSQRRINVGVTNDLLEWSHETRANHFIYMSSVAAFGGVADGTWIRTEKDFSHFSNDSKDFEYFSSKREAHQRLIDQCKVPLSIFCPGIVHGSLEHYKSSRGHLRALREGRLRWAPPGGANFVALDRVAESLAAAAAAKATEKNQCRLLTDVNLSYQDYFSLYVKIARGKEAQKISPLPVFSRTLSVKTLGILTYLGLRVPAVLKGLAQASLFLFFRSEFPQPDTEGLATALEKSLKSL